MYWIEQTKRDLVHGLRVLRRRPVFGSVAIATLALCIGVNGAVLTLVDGILLRPLPWPEPERLAEVVREVRSSRGQGVDVAQDGRVWEAVRDHVEPLESAVHSTWLSGVYLTGADSVIHVQQQRVGAGFFRVLGRELLYGRELTPEEDRAGGPQAVVLGHSLWRSAFGADPSVVGSSVTLSGEPHTVVGVLAPGPLPTVGADLFTPLRATSSGEGAGTNFRIVSRLQPGTSWSEAEARIAAIGEEVLDRPEAADVEIRLGLAPFDRELRSGLRPLLLVLWAAVAAILLIGCTNLGAMLTARGDERVGEIATRLALGGDRRTIVRQLLTESLVLALFGGALALGVARVVLASSERLLRETFGIWQPLELDLRVLGMIGLLTIATTVLFGLLPALRAGRMDIRAGLVEAGGRGAAGGARRWLRRSAVVGQVALCVALLLGAGLLLRSVQHLGRLAPGFDPEGVITARVAMRDARYRDAESVTRFFERSLTEVRRIPGVDGAAVGLSLPFERGLNMTFRFPGLPEDEPRLTTLVYVTPQYFESLRIPLLRGRTIEDRDRAERERVVVVDRTFVEQYLGGTDPLGESLQVQGMPPARIVGVVGDVQQRPGWGGDLGPLSPMPTVYLPVTQLDDGFFDLVHTWFSPAWVVRSSLESSALGTQLQAAVTGVDPLLPLIRFRRMEELHREAIGIQRALASSLSAFAGLALVLAAAGVYGVLTSVVSARRRELGIRLALGASRAATVLKVTGEALRLVVVGLAIGVPLAVAAAAGLRGLLFGVDTADLPTLVGVALVLLLTALLASIAPALQVAGVDPARTLRED